MMLPRAVKPVWQRWILNPRMQRPDVIRHSIEKNLHFLFVRCRHKALIIPQRTQVRIHRVQIHRAVPVVILRRPILHHRREPQSCDAKLLQIRQMILDPA